MDFKELGDEERCIRRSALGTMNVFDLTWILVRPFDLMSGVRIISILNGSSAPLAAPCSF